MKKSAAQKPAKVRENISRPQLRRLIALDKMLRENKYPNCPTAAKLFEVTRKTVQRDIDLLRHCYDAPIKFDNSRNGYFYTEPRYFPNLTALRERDVLALVAAEKALEPYRTAPYYRDLKAALEKITETLPQSFSLGDARTLVHFESPPVSALDADTLERLQDAAVKKRRVRLTYHAHYSGETTERLFDPYTLLCRDGRWYAAGFCHERKAIRFFDVARILTLDLTKDTFIPDKEFRLKDYYDGDFLREGKRYEIKLRFQPREARWIRERVWHSSQTLEDETDGSCVMTVVLPRLSEIKRWIQRFGAGVEVLKPRLLRTLLKADADAVSALYLKP